MGSKPIAKKQSRRPKKSLSPRFEHLKKEFIQNGGEWKGFELNKVFDIKTPKKRFDANKITFGGIFPYVARLERNNGIRGYITESTEFLNDANTISFGQDTATMYYQKDAYFTGDKIKIFKLKENELNATRAIFLISCLKKAFHNFSWGSMFSEKILNKVLVQLPTRNNEIDFSFMESTICALEAERLELLEVYLISTNLHDYHLTPAEEQALQDFDKIEWKDFKFSEVFNQIKQGRRLKKQDQLPGNIPFVMAGTTNTGVVNFISNPVATFPANTITIDIFGNTFYRNYDFGAGDDTGVYWSDSKDYSKQQMLYLATAMGKSIEGKFSYGKKLRSSQSTNFKMVLPQTNEKIDLEKMEILVKAIEKLVIKDVVLWADENIEATREVINKN